MRSSIIIGLAVLISLGPRTASGQTRTPTLTTEVSFRHDSGNGNSTGQAERPAPQQRNPRYQVTRDDVLSISFPLSPELNQKVMVQPDGYITLLSAGSIYVQGMTVPDIVESLKKAYLQILRSPIIDVDLVDFQKPYFLVSGQVGKPGQYDLRHDTTVSEAVALAGGFLPSAKTQVFLYRRVSSGWLEVKKMNIKDILNGKNINEDAQMHPGDMIFVPEKFIINFRKYVPYSPGVYVNPLAAF